MVETDTASQPVKQRQAGTGRYTHPAKYGLIFSDMEEDLEGSCLAVHAVVNPLVDGK